MDSAPQSVHFLLVEDDDDHAEIVRRAMKDARVLNRLTRVSDGEAALAYVNAQPPYEDATRPDVILLDLHLPRLDGHEVLEALKSNPETAPIPVVIMSTSGAPTDRLRAYQSHVNSYLIKPMDGAAFNQMVQDLGMYWSVWNQRAIDASA